MCLISFLSHFVSLIDADAANNAALFTLKGGFSIFKDLMISFEEYPQPTRIAAKPYIFEKVLVIKTFL